jgi:putative transposase
VTLTMPRLRKLPFETEIIERYRRQSNVEEAVIELDLARVSVRQVEDITEELWGTQVSLNRVSALNQKIYGPIETWRSRPIEGEHIRV